MTKNFYEETWEPMDLLPTSSVLAREVFGFLSLVHPWDVEDNVGHQSYPRSSCVFSFINVWSNLRSLGYGNAKYLCVYGRELVTLF